MIKEIEARMSLRSPYNENKFLSEHNKDNWEIIKKYGLVNYNKKAVASGSEFLGGTP